MFWWKYQFIAPPNLNYYLFYGEQVNNEFNYDEIIYNDDIINAKKKYDSQNKIKNLLEKEYDKYKDLF